MAIPNETVTENEIEEARRQEAIEEEKEARRRAANSLEKGLVDTFPASDPVSVVQPPQSKQDRGIKR